jgi:tetratricopeptide (TPR) repeat protein
MALIVTASGVAGEAKLCDVLSAAPPAVPVTVHGALFVWPALDAMHYADAAARPFAADLGSWRAGAPPARAERPAASPAARYLAADLEFLSATTGATSWATVAAAYERALREAPHFPDAVRAHFLLGQAFLELGSGVEAGAAFTRLERRYPEHALVPDARLGRAEALRLRGRAAEARGLVSNILARAHGDLLCRALREQAATAVTRIDAARAFHELAASCPQVLGETVLLREYAETLMQAGDVDAARALLALPREPGPADDEARLRLLAGAVAADPAEARQVYEQVAATNVSETIAVEAALRLGLLDAATDPGRAAAAVLSLADRRVPQGLRAVALGEAATLLGRAERFEEALVQLDRAAALGAEGAAQSEERRGEILGRWIATLAARDDDVGLATMYAARTTDVQARASVEDRATVARALADVGLHDSAVKLLAGTGPEATAEVAAALGEEAVVAGAGETVSHYAAGLGPAALPAALADRACAVRARTPLLREGPRAAAAEAAWVRDLEVRATIAAAFLDVPGGASEASALLLPLVEGRPAAPVRVLLIAGAAALAEGAWEAAAVSYENAILGGAAGAERLEALAGLLRAADADGDAALVTAALSHVEADEDAIVGRVAATLKQRLRRARGSRGA